MTLLVQPSVTSAEQTQQFGGFLEGVVQAYPRRPNEADTHGFLVGHLQPWGTWTLNQHLFGRVSLDLWLDTHHDIDRDRWFDINQRGLRRPAGAFRDLYVDAKIGHVDLRLGKQEIRWGRADFFSPTDNVMPYDYLNIVTYNRIPVPAAKTDVYIGGAHVEAVWVPLFIPTRLPLLNQRWFPSFSPSGKAPLGPQGEDVDVDFAFRDGEVNFPARTLTNGQWGLRWNQQVRHAEFSLSYFDGFDDIASFRPTTSLLGGGPRPLFLITLNREYHQVRVVGADGASALGPFGIRGEVAHFAYDDPARRDRVTFVGGIDRTWEDWFAIVEYVDQITTSSQRGTIFPGQRDGSLVFPDEGLRSMILYRIEWTINSFQSLEFRGAVGVRPGDEMVQFVYDKALSDQWRMKLIAALFGGPRTSYWGQYSDNGFLALELRYTF